MTHLLRTTVFAPTYDEAMRLIGVEARDFFGRDRRLLVTDLTARPSGVCFDGQVSRWEVDAEVVVDIDS